MRLCLDLDNTICKPKINKSDDYYDLEPFPEAVETLRHLKSEGHHIIIHTARGMVTYHESLSLIYLNHYDNIVDWLNKWNIPYDELILGKPFADHYIDDKAIFHYDWNVTKQLLSTPKG